MAVSEYLWPVAADPPAPPQTDMGSLDRHGYRPAFFRPIEFDRAMRAAYTLAIVDGPMSTLPVMKGEGIMTNKAFEERIIEICEIIEALPAETRAPLMKLVEETRQRYASIYDSSKAARDALDDLRLRCKYMVFDAEARLRETQKDPDQRADGPPF